jgi:hypothetical protein
MKKIVTLAAAAALVSLGACNKSPEQAAADNIEANADAMADNMEELAGNTSDPAMANMLENEADATRAEGANMAEDLTTHDADTNLSNGI